MRSELQKLARELGVADRTIFTGFVSDDQLVATLKSSNIIVIPSRFEPFGITALEAMAAGIPVVVSRVGGLAEIVNNNVDGLEVDPESPDAISDGVIRVLSEPELAEGFVLKAREKVKGYSWGSAAEATLRVYQSAMGDSRYE